MSRSGSPGSLGALVVAVPVGLIGAGHAWWRPPAWIDEAFVPFRYADRFADGFGLRLGEAPATEGFLDPLWTLCLAALSWVGVDVVKLAPVVGIVGFGLLCGVVAAAGARRHGSALHALPGLLLASWAPAALAARDGTDAVLVGLLGVLAVLATSAERDASEPRCLAGLWLSLLALTGVPGAVLAVLLALGRARRLLAVSAVLLVLAAWRLWLFGDLVPTAVRALPWGGSGRIEDGLAGLGALFISAPVLVGGGLLGAVIGWTRGVVVPRAIGLVAIFGVLQVGLGTDPVWSAFVPAAGGLALLMSHAMFVGRGKSRWMWLPVFAAALGLDTMNGAMRCDAETEIRAEAHADSRAMARFLRWRFEPDAVVAVHRPGVVPYYAGTGTVDLSGRTDSPIARKSRLDPAETGHPFRFDMAGVIERNPDAFLPHTHLLADGPTRIVPPGTFTDAFARRYMQHAIQVKRAWKVTEELPAWVHIYIRRDLPMLRPGMTEKQGNRLPDPDPFGGGGAGDPSPPIPAAEDTGN